MLRAMALGIVLVGGSAVAADEKMHFDVAHPFSRADARARAQMLFDYWQQKYGIDCSWKGDSARISGRVMGVEINAVLVVGDDRVGGDGEDPGPFFRGLARSYITKKLQKYMDPLYREP